MSKEAMKLAKAWFERNTYGDEAVDVYEALCEALAEQPAQQEPVAWLIDNGGDAVLIRHSENFPGVFAGSEFRKQPLVYGDKLSPAQRKPLTDEQMWSLWNSQGDDAMEQTAAIAFARAIEAAHGIKENT